MKLETAQRKRAKIRMNIASPSGFGKTYSSLLVAYGICQDWEKIGVIDTENDSASLYSHLGRYKTLRLDAPYTPDRYVQAINTCEEGGMEVIIIDSITHVWKGTGGVLEFQNQLGGRYQDWAKATPLYMKFINSILNSRCHIITTNRKKQAYNLITEGNKTKVEKAGMDDEIRDGYEYEMTLAFEIINDNHLAKASKDRTGLFANVPEFVIGVHTGTKILEWCNSGEPVTKEDISKRIGDTASIQQLLSLYYQYPHFSEELKAEYEQQKRRILVNQEVNSQLTHTQNFSTNGIH